MLSIGKLAYLAQAFETESAVDEQKLNGRIHCSRPLQDKVLHVTI